MAKKKVKTKQNPTMPDIARQWLGEQSNLYMNLMEEGKQIDLKPVIKRSKADKGRLVAIQSELDRLEDEYVADAKLMMHKWLGMKDDEYQMHCRNLVTLAEKLNEDAHDDLGAIVDDIKKTKIKMSCQIADQIFKGAKHVDKCLAEVEHEDMLGKIRLRIADMTVAKSDAQKAVTSIGNDIKKLVGSLEKRIAVGPSPGPLFDQPTKDEQKKKQIDEVMTDCPKCNGAGIGDDKIECEECGATGKAMADGQRDKMFDAAVRLVIVTDSRSVSALQRQLNVGYAHATQLMKQLVEAGILGEKDKDVLMTLEQYEKGLLEEKSKEAALT